MTYGDVKHTLVSNLDKEDRWLLTQLLAWSVVSVACPVMEMYEGDRFSFVILIGGYLLFPLSFVGLSLSLWSGVSTRRLSRTEAWWWLSVPYSLGFPVAFLVFRLTVFFHVVAPFLLVWFMTSLSSVVWLLVTIYRVIVSPTEKFTTTKKVMIGLAAFTLLISIVWTGSQR